MTGLVARDPEVADLADLSGADGDRRAARTLDDEIRERPRSAPSFESSSQDRRARRGQVLERELTELNWKRRVGFVQLSGAPGETPVGVPQDSTRVEEHRHRFLAPLVVAQDTLEVHLDDVPILEVRPRVDGHAPRHWRAKLEVGPTNV